MTALSAIAVSLFGYVLARKSVVSEVDAALLRDHQRFEKRLITRGSGLGLAQETDSGPVALINGNGRALRSTPIGSRTFTQADIDIAQAGSAQQFSDRTIDGRRYRFLTVPATELAGPGKLARFDLAKGGPGMAIVIGRDVENVHDQLRQLAAGFALLGIVGTTVSALAALVTVRIGTKPLTDLVAVVDAIATDGDAPQHASEVGPPDIRRLNAGVNTMLDSLRESRATQQRMIDDAAHELRTPLTSMQTNLDMLERSDRLQPEVQQDVIRALMKQFRELRSLVDDLGILAESHSPSGHAVPTLQFDFKDVVDIAIERAQQRSGKVHWVSELQSFPTTGHADQLERAVVNILDNAVKWSPPGGTVSVTLCDGQLQISDEGPGVPAAERSQVFDRFWRASNTRNTPGSGLGLAIVADVVAKHHGSVSFGEHANGGALVTLRLPSDTSQPPTGNKGPTALRREQG
jgi:two-component system, OmpR family, sensor histidine kinase MprB